MATEQHSIGTSAEHWARLVPRMNNNMASLLACHPIAGTDNVNAYGMNQDSSVSELVPYCTSLAIQTVASRPFGDFVKGPHSST